MFPVKRIIPELIKRRQTWIRPALLSGSSTPHGVIYESCRGKKSGNKKNLIESLFVPIPVTPNSDDINVGAEITGALNKNDLQKLLSRFYQHAEVRNLIKDYGLSAELQAQAFSSFRCFCLQNSTLPADLHVVISDILQGASHISDIFPYFIRHVKEIFPHIDCMDELKQISDLRTPANWYPMARSKIRKIIFHAGPTNSGKTYYALERFRKAKSGVYCGPLKLLATEVFHKINNLNTPCDLVTGEERLYARNDVPANHVACTVEMARVNVSCEVAVIDEIQLLQDYGRGWAWTRALLGIPADEIHLCGEGAAIDLVRSLCLTTGETVDVRHYKRLTDMQLDNAPLLTLKNVQPGDCIVCFNKNDIYTVSRELEMLGVENAVIYGSLPPNTKLNQSAKFNDPNHPCKVLVSTDAIGMGLNLHIRRIIFYSLIKPSVNEKGEKEMNLISVSSALQIAGRAGRYGTQWEKGYVTTFRSEDYPLLEKLLQQTPEPKTQAGLQPTADQIELYAYHLPKATLSNLMDIFVSLCTVDNSLYFMCNIDDFKFLADIIQHVPLPLRARYVFCCAPIGKKMPYPCTMFLKFARRYSKNELITAKWLCQEIGWPVQPPKCLVDLVHLEAIFDVLDLYLWLSYRFVDLFPDINDIKNIQRELDVVIYEGIVELTKLLRATEAELDNRAALNEENINSNRPNEWNRSNSRNNHKQGKLTDRLLAQGLLTPSMLQELQREWMKRRDIPENRNRFDMKKLTPTRPKK